MAVGIQFTETMRGHVSTTVLDDYAKGEADGKRAGTTLQFTVTVSTTDIDAMLRDPSHKARLDGTITCPTLSPSPLQVTDGTFHLLSTDPTRPNARQMVYQMVGRAPDGATWRVEGFKQVEDNSHLEIWADTTTLFVTVTSHVDGRDQLVGKGVVHILPADFLKQLTTMKPTGAANPLEGLRALVAFGRFFAGALFDVYGPVAHRQTPLRPDAPPRERRALRLPTADLHHVRTGDGVELRLTRYHGGTKGPVMLAPGFGTSTLAFSIDTVDTNLPEALVAAGYDVWLFDYRSSPDLPSASTQFTLDEVATEDWPAAVAEVRRLTGAPTVQVMAHCVGSLTFLMAMLRGMQGVRSAVSSALTLFPVSPLLNRIRAGLDLGTAAQKAGLQTLTTDFDSQRTMDRIIDGVLQAFPTPGWCKEPVCRRILGIYGEVYKHANLNDATHHAIHEMFGVANMTTFNHLSKMVREGHVVDGAGGNTYMPHLDRLAIPLTIVTGQENGLFLPEGTTKTLQALAKVNNAALYQQVAFAGYAHMDLYIGQRSHVDVYPTIVAELNQHN
jgi:choline dehydrogenase-like flavoprotein